jgi:hypothetical protein
VCHVITTTQNLVRDTYAATVKEQEPYDILRLVGFLENAANGSWPITAASKWSNDSVWRWRR